MKINPQDIPNKLIKIASEPLSITFTYIDIQSIANCVVPNAFKISGVTPIHKSSETATDIGNYRPVTALSSFSKVLQRLTYDQLNSFLEKKKLNDIIHKDNFGYRKYSAFQTIRLWN